MDAFFAAVEQLDNPELRGKPILIGHPGPRGVVATASYEARPFGVGSAMPMSIARKRCPDAIVVKPRLSRYAEYSKKIMRAFRTFSPLVEPLSLDEAFIDLTGAEKLWGSPQQIGAKIKASVFEATGGLHVSVGIASTKYVAKVASDQDKPNGLTIVEPHKTLEFLWPMTIDKIWGIGKRNHQKLSQLHLHTIRDIAKSDPVWLKQELGSLGEHIYRLAHANDPREVIIEHDAKSIGAEFTLDKDIEGRKAILPHLLRSADRIAPQLRKRGLVANGLRVKLKTHFFQIQTRQSKLRQPSANAHELYQAGCQMLDRFDLDHPLRLVGMAAFGLEFQDEKSQMDLFQDPQTHQRHQRQRLDQHIDDIRDKFGLDALKRGSDLES
jgi:DNA polymerase IV